MVRLLGILIGLGFVIVASVSLVADTYRYMTTDHEETAEHRFHEHPRSIAFSTDGPFGRFDNQQLQRGFQVYREVCASCHGLNYVAFRNLREIGYTEAEVRKVASEFQVPDINQDTGEATTRPGLPADRFPSPYPNEVAARAANNNASPPDLSLIVKARHGGAEYISSLLTGYRNPQTYRNHDGEALPEDNRPGQGLHFNPYFPNLNIAMPPPITRNGQVQYADGTPATMEQMANDVSAFLTWTAEPNLQRRHRAGLAVMIFLIFASILSYLAYKNVWATAKRTVRVAGPLDPENIAKSNAAKRDAGIEG
ncbi:MAG TPA: cytochrome c1 [Allosphingosinicella sp.]|jgi:ubiquinol-cytochrome c reductase cytochrome c1 subunit